MRGSDVCNRCGDVWVELHPETARTTLLAARINNPDFSKIVGSMRSPRVLECPSCGMLSIREAGGVS